VSSKRDISIDDSPLMFVPYEVVPITQNANAKSISRETNGKHVKLVSIGAHSMWNQKDQEYFASTVELKGWKASTISVSCWKKLLNLFGMERSVKDDVIVSPDEIVQFSLCFMDLTSKILKVDWRL